MNLILPEFDARSLPELAEYGNKATPSPWGWIGAVNRENDTSRETFLRAVKEGDFETAHRFQDVGRNLLFAVARVSGDNVTVALLEKVAEPIAPTLVATWTVENEGVRVVLSETGESERLLRMTRLSWRESLSAMLRSLKS